MGLTAQEALAFGLVSRLAPDDAVDSEAAALAAKLADGPTRAFGPVRRMLLNAEKDSIIVASSTEDAQQKQLLRAPHPDHAWQEQGIAAIGGQAQRPIAQRDHVRAKRR